MWIRHFISLLGRFRSKTRQSHKIMETNDEIAKAEIKPPKKSGTGWKIFTAVLIILILGAIMAAGVFIYWEEISARLFPAEEEPVIEVNENVNTTTNENGNVNIAVNQNANQNLNVNLSVSTVDEAEIQPDEGDYDADGIKNVDEYLTYGTDPGQWDTDGDFYSDGEEVVGGFDPLAKVDPSAIEGWKKFVSDQLGISMQSPATWPEPVFDSADYTDDTSGYMSGKKYELVFRQKFDEPETYIMSIVGFTGDYQGFKDFSYNGAVPKEYCPQEMDYDSQGTVCRYFPVSENISLAVMKNEASRDECGGVAISTVFVWPVPDSYQIPYDGLAIFISLTDVNQSIIDVFSEESPMCDVDEPKMTYNQALQQSKNVMLLESLSDRDKDKLNTAIRILKTIEYK